MLLTTLLNNSYNLRKINKRGFSQQSKKGRKEKGINYKPFGNTFFMDVKSV